MSENLNIFPNSKPPILGEDTHAANLTGDLTTVTKGPEGSSGGNGNLSSLQSGDTGVGGFSFTPTTEKNVAFLRISVFTTNDSLVQIKEGAVVLASAGGATGTKTVSHVVKDTTIGLHSYSYTIVKQVSNYQFGESGGFGNNGPISSGSGVDIIDTHAADLIGANTQSTHEQAVLPK